MIYAYKKCWRKLMENNQMFDFVINDEDEVMLLLYVQNDEPLEAFINIDAQNKKAVLHRNPAQELELVDIPEDVLDSLQDADKLMICELSIEEDESKTQIVYAYEADINL